MGAGIFWILLETGSGGGAPLEDLNLLQLIGERFLGTLDTETPERAS